MLSGAWKDSLEDWAAEDWNEDVSDFMNVKMKLGKLDQEMSVCNAHFSFYQLSETKVFTASYALGSKNLVQPGQG